jgi:hypothetical protein
LSEALERRRSFLPQLGSLLELLNSAKMSVGAAMARRWQRSSFIMMTTQKSRTSIFLLLLGCSVVFKGAALISGCASDPNKDANDAHNAELKSDRKGRQNAAEQRGDQREDLAEQQRKAQSAQYAVGNEANRDRQGADAKMIEAREKAKSKATERLDKADAKATELKSIVTRSGHKATTAAHDSLRLVDQQRQQAKMSIDQLSSSRDDSFEQMKSNTDTQLDTLEGYVKRAENEVEKFK